MGLLYTPQRGATAFTVPHFDRFLLRVIPTLPVPELKPRRRPSTASEVPGSASRAG